MSGWIGQQEDHREVLDLPTRALTMVLAVVAQEILGLPCVFRRRDLCCSSGV